MEDQPQQELNEQYMIIIESQKQIISRLKIFINNSLANPINFNETFQTNDRLQQMVKNLEDKLKEADQQKNDFKLKVKNLEQEIDRLNQNNIEFKKRDQEYIDLKKFNEELFKKYQDQTNIIQSLKQVEQNLKQQNQQSNIEKIIFQQQLQKKFSQEKNLYEKIKENEISKIVLLQFKQKENDMASKISKIQELTKDYQNLLQKYKNQYSIQNDGTATQNVLTDQNNDCLTLYKQQIQSLKKELQLQNEVHDNLNVQITQKEFINQHSIDIIQKLEFENNKIKQDMKQQQQINVFKINQLRQQNDQLKIKIKSFNQKDQLQDYEPQLQKKTIVQIDTKTISQNKTIQLNATVYSVCAYKLGFITGSSDDKLRFWNSSYECTQEIVLESAVLAICSLSNGQVCTAENNGLIRIIDNHQIIQTLIGHEGCNITALLEIKHENCTYLASGSSDTTIKIWSLDNFELKSTLFHHQGGINGMILIDNKICSVSDDKSIVISNPFFNLKKDVLVGHEGRILCIVSIGNNQIATGSSDKLIKIWNINTKQEIKSIQAHSLDICSIQFHQNFLISGSYDKLIKLIDLKGEVINTFEGHSKRILSLTLLNNNHELVSTSNDNKIIIWSLN